MSRAGILRENAERKKQEGFFVYIGRFRVGAAALFGDLTLETVRGRVDGI